MTNGVLSLILLLLACGSTSVAAEYPETMITLEGTSGFPLLTTADLVPVGFLSLQGGVIYERLDTDMASLRLPLAVSYGLMETLEVGGDLDVYMDDDRDDAVLGDLELAAKYLYETARSGSSVGFLGRLSLPTGAEGRDSGSELGLGLVHTSNFRMFRLSGSMQYILSGGQNPFEDDIEDYASFQIGGTSFIGSDVQFFLSGTGTTAGNLVASAGASAILAPKIRICFHAGTALDGYPDFAIGGALNWGVWLD